MIKTYFSIKREMIWILLQMNVQLQAAMVECSCCERHDWLIRNNSMDNLLDLVYHIKG